MNTANDKIQKDIVQILHNQGITEVGFASAEPFVGYADFIMEKHKKFQVHYDNSYGKSLEDEGFYSPAIHVRDAKSIITMILPYHMSIDKKKATPLQKQGDGKCKISKASLFKDYHLMMQEILKPVSEYIRTVHHKEALICCDTGPLNDKAVLLRTGGFKLLRNSLLWHKKYGSRFYIGYIITDLHLHDEMAGKPYESRGKSCETAGKSGDTPLESASLESMYHPFCKTCGRCAKACPNKAITEHGHLNSGRCISYLTQANTWSRLSELGQGLTLKGYVYGCDICQLVCPLNGMDLSKDFYYEPLVHEYVGLEDIEDLTNRQFKAIYNQSSAGWIGKKRFIRNLKENGRH